MSSSPSHQSTTSSSKATAASTAHQGLTPSMLDDFITAALNSCGGGSSSRVSHLAKPNLAISEAFARQLCLQAREIFLSQSVVLDLEAPIKVCGDFHGQFHDLLRMFDVCGVPPLANYLFLGDYVDRGKYGVETMCLLLALKIRYPENFFLLRGNHENSSISRIYGFFDECKRKFGARITAWKTFTDCFNCLPIAAVIEEKIFCCHGGLSPEVMTKKDLNMLKRVVRPCDVADSGAVCDLLWSDPDEGTYGWAENDGRCISFLFGADTVKKFLHNMDFDLICRGHQVVEDGYQFFGKRQLVTIFSAPNYCGEFDNSGAVMTIDSELTCSFTILKPVIANGR